MTVGELIAELQKIPQDKEVYAYCQDKKIFFPNIEVVEHNNSVTLYCEEDFEEH